MLKKCFKHEWIAYSRIFLPLLLIVVIITPVLGLIGRLTKNANVSGNPIANAGSALSILGYVLILTAVCIASFILVIMRFYRSVATDEAYLTFTIPAKTSTIIHSKLWVAVIWETISTIVIGLSIAFYTLLVDAWKWSDLVSFLKDFNSIIAHTGIETHIFVLFVISCIVALIISTIEGTIMIYASIALGQMVQKHRVIASFVFYFALYTVAQIASFVVVLPITIKAVDMANATQGEMIRFYFTTMGASCLLSVILGIAFFIVTERTLTKRLNLE